MADSTRSVAQNPDVYFHFFSYLNRRHRFFFSFCVRIQLIIYFFRFRMLLIFYFTHTHIIYHSPYIVGSITRHGTRVCSILFWFFGNQYRCSVFVSKFWWWTRCGRISGGLSDDQSDIGWYLCYPVCALPRTDVVDHELLLLSRCVQRVNELTVRWSAITGIQKNVVPIHLRFVIGIKFVTDYLVIRNWSYRIRRITKNRIDLIWYTTNKIDSSRHLAQKY